MPNEHTTEAKGGHRTIWMPYLDERGRKFHRKVEDNGGIPGTYVGFSPDGGLTWTCMKIGTREDMDPPLRAAGPMLKTDCIGGIGFAKYALMPPGWRASWEERHDAHVALLARHANATGCSRCGGRDLWLATIDARTVEERVYCVSCDRLLRREFFASQIHYRQFECACGTLGYVQVKPATRERGDYNDVLPCPKCSRLACVECLAEGAKACRGCVKTRRRKAA